MSAEQGFGLEGVLRQRGADLVGILNGVDYHQWNPWTDPYLADHYGENSLELKSSCKKKLRRALGLADKRDTPLLAMISRLTPQKGFDLIENIFAALMERQVQFVVLGTGAPRYEDFFRAAAARYPEQVGGAHRFRRAPCAPDRGGSGSFLDAVALRALRPQPDV